MGESSKSVLLYGGGIDSTTLLFLLRRLGVDPYVLYFQYGQKAALLERQCLDRWVPKHKQKVVDLPLSSLVTSDIMEGEKLAETPKSNVLEGRNLIFISMAAAWASTLGAEVVYVGFHSEPEGAPFPDATDEFRERVNAVLKAGMNHRVSVEAPFRTWTRDKIFHWALKNAPEALDAHTCYEDVVGGCGKCSHCLLKAKILLRFEKEI